MKPDDLQVYDNFPLLFRRLTDAAGTMAGLPLDDMLKAVDRVALAGGWYSGTAFAAFPAEIVQAQRKLVEAALVLRATLVPPEPSILTP